MKGDQTVTLVSRRRQSNGNVAMLFRVQRLSDRVKKAALKT